MMIKKYCLLVFIITALFSYGQNVTFQKNASSTASKLLVVQQLNKSGDSLILESESNKIRQVDILNEDYLETIKIDSLKGKISLKKIPNGNYVIQARIGGHWIVMYMEKRNWLSTGLNFTDVKINTELNNVSLIAKGLKENTLPLQPYSVENNFKENKMYWVVYESNSQFSSVKTMGLKCADEILDLILRIKLEVKSEIGKNNKLFVYEVYHKSEFMSMQLRNVKYYKKTESKFFNVLPLYNSEDEKSRNSQS